MMRKIFGGAMAFSVVGAVLLGGVLAWQASDAVHSQNQVGAGGLDVRIHRGAAIHFLENRLSEDQEVVEDTPDHLRFRATVPDTAELRWWVLSLGQRAEVLGPRELRAEMAGIVAEMAATYGGDRR